MTEYMKLIEDDDVMKDVWKRKAEASAEYLRFRGDMEAYNKYVEAEMNALGYRSEPTGRGTTVLVPITG